MAPFVSKAQRDWMYANKPEMAKKWQEHTPAGTVLPEHVAQKKAKVPKVVRDAKKRIQKFQPVFSKNLLK